jgi:hypothetical protein
LKALLNNPDDLPQVFTLFEALEGSTPERLRAGLLASPTGRALLNDSGKANDRGALSVRHRKFNAANGDGSASQRGTNFRSVVLLACRTDLDGPSLLTALAMNYLYTDRFFEVD